MAILNTNEIMFTAFEPKLQNRFIMFIDGIPAYLIKKISRPSITFGEVVLDHINVKRKIKGKQKTQITNENNENNFKITNQTIMNIIIDKPAVYHLLDSN